MDARTTYDRNPLGHRPHGRGSARCVGESRWLQKFPESSGRRLRTRPPRVATRPARDRAAAAAGLRDAAGIICGIVRPDAALETYNPPGTRPAVSRRHHYLPAFLGADSGLTPAGRLVVVE